MYDYVCHLVDSSIIWMLKGVEASKRVVQLAILYNNKQAFIRLKLFEAIYVCTSLAVCKDGASTATLLLAASCILPPWLAACFNSTQREASYRYVWLMRVAV